MTHLSTFSEYVYGEFKIPDGSFALFNYSFHLLRNKPGL